MKSKNSYSIEGNTAKIYFRTVDGYFLCDVEDLEKLLDYTWHKNPDGYAVARKKLSKNGQRETAHGIVMGRQEGKEIDHINRNKLDNRKENLRFVTHSENMRNTEKVLRPNAGVYWRKGRYISSIHVGNKTIHLGCFASEQEAIAARKKAEKIYWR